jgi:hypothetical protein
MTLPDRPAPRWRKSSYSADQKECVEVLLDEDEVAVRDTKDREGGEFHVAPAAWRGLLAKIREQQQ